MTNIAQKTEFDLSGLKEIPYIVYSALDLLEKITFDKKINDNVRIESFIDSHNDWKIKNIYVDEINLKFYIEESFELDIKKIYELASNKAKSLHFTFSANLKNLH